MISSSGASLRSMKMIESNCHYIACTQVLIQKLFLVWSRQQVLIQKLFLLWSRQLLESGCSWAVAYGCEMKHLSQMTKYGWSDLLPSLCHSLACHRPDPTCVPRSRGHWRRRDDLYRLLRACGRSLPFNDLFRACALASCYARSRTNIYRRSGYFRW